MDSRLIFQNKCVEYSILTTIGLAAALIQIVGVNNITLVISNRDYNSLIIIILLFYSLIQLLIICNYLHQAWNYYRLKAHCAKIALTKFKKDPNTKGFFPGSWELRSILEKTNNIDGKGLRKEFIIKIIKKFEHLQPQIIYFSAICSSCLITFLSICRFFISGTAGYCATIFAATGLFFLVMLAIFAVFHWKAARYYEDSVFD